MACSCPSPDIAVSFENATDVVSVQIDAKRRRGNTLWMLATVQRTFKGCTEARDQVWVSTSASSAACGVTNLKVGGSYLLNGAGIGSMRGLNALRIGLCDFNIPTSDLSRSNISFLRKNAESCELMTCDDLADEDFGDCRMVLGVGVVDGECATISGCSLPEDVTLAETVRACESTCGE